MRTRLGALLVTMTCLLAAAVPARADFVCLKNGRKVEGEVLRDDAKGVLLKKDSGLVNFPRDVVDHVERRSTATRPMAGKPGSKPPAAGGTRWDRSPTAAPSADDVPAAVVSQCRGWLESTAALEGDARAERLKEGRSRFGLPVYVALLGELPRAGRELAARELARQIVLDAGPEARPALVRAVQKTRTRTPEVPALLESAWDASVEKELSASLPRMDPLQQEITCELLGRHGGRVAGEALEDLALTVSDRPNLAVPVAVGEALAAISARDENPSELLMPLVEKLAAKTLPKDYGWEAVLIPLAAVPRPALPALQRCRQSLEADYRLLDSTDPRLQVLLNRLQKLYGIFAACGDPEALVAVRAAVETEIDPSRRVLWLRCLAQAKSSGKDAELIGWLLDRWDAHADEEAETIADVLESMTSVRYGRAVGAWRGYARSLVK